MRLHSVWSHNINRIHHLEVQFITWDPFLLPGKLTIRVRPCSPHADLDRNKTKLETNCNKKKLSASKMYIFMKNSKQSRDPREAISYLESIAKGVIPNDLTVIAIARPGISLSNIDLVAYQRKITLSHHIIQFHCSKHNAITCSS